MIREFLKKESAGGIVLMLASALAILVANSPLSHYYELFLSTPVEVRVGGLEIAKPLILWINDGLMAVFFFLIGLELKRETVQGELSDPKQVLFPAIGAIGGMAAPALIYVLFNRGDAIALKGWAIPAATDIAFALGVLALLGSRVPISLKVFLTSLAIFDDLAAILVIAFFYTSKISVVALALVAVCILILILLNRFHVTSKSFYLLIGVFLWIATLKSGVHATLAGVILAMFVPLRDLDSDQSPLLELEHDLHHMVAFFVLPVFAFANAGLNLSGMNLEQALHGVPLGIALGLFLGKQVGVFGFCALAVMMKVVALPRGMSMRDLYGTAALCGIGFTMSLFIGSLAFEEVGTARLFDERMGILAGSIVSGLFGYFLLRSSLKERPELEPELEPTR